jgi:hypothetical protein
MQTLFRSKTHDRNGFEKIIALYEGSFSIEVEREDPAE